MSVLVDTSVWSLAFRRKSPASETAEQLRELILREQALLIGAIRQEVLSGISFDEQFEALRDKLRAFPDVPLDSQDFETAASIYNRCRARGVQGSNTDFLICAASLRHGVPIFTTDRDFGRYRDVVPITLF